MSTTHPSWFHKINSSNQANTPTEPTTGKHSKRTRLQHPGRMRVPVQLMLHTLEVQLLLNGYQKAPKLTHFSWRMNQLRLAAQEDDPYADYMLLQVYDECLQLYQSLQSAVKKLSARCLHETASEHLTMIAPHAEQPLVKTLNFNNPYGYLGAQILAALDQFLCLTRMSCRMGLVMENEYDGIRDHWLAQCIVAFKRPFQWKAFGITRQDIRDNNELAQKAKNRMGTLPEAILNGTIQSPFSSAKQKK
ncbi:MAG: DUF1845 domain-containing protein [Gammaproteobacteria bacterium]|nr:DUF1845 domain-containing protein [Gammaproteobacteria bacterium]